MEIDPNIKAGEFLKQNRESQGKSIEWIVQKTKIHTRFIQAIENNDYSSLPNEVVIKGFLKLYADRLGLETEIVLDIYKRETSEIPTESEKEEEVVEKIVEIKEENTPHVPFDLKKILTSLDLWQKKVLAGAIILLVIIGMFFLVREVQNWFAYMALNQEAPLKEDYAKRITKGAGVKVFCEFTDRTWIRVISDGKVIYQQVIDKGKKKLWQAKEKLAIRAGNAGGVYVVANGNVIGQLGETGKVVDRAFFPDK